MPAPRPLARSLVPLPGESLPGFLLRLSFRLGIAPGQLAELTGLAPAGRGRRAPAVLLTRIPETAIRAFTFMTRLTGGEVTQLSLVSWQGCYPPPAAGRRARENRAGAGSTISAGMPATPAGYFADLRALGLLACWTWPSVRHLSPSEDTASAIDEHVASLRRHEASPGPAARTRFGRLPANAAASAGLAYIADRILGGSPDDVRELLREFLPSSTRKASRTYWGLRVLRSETPCSEGLKTAYGPLLRTFTKDGGQSRGRRNAVLRPGRWGPENIPAFLEQAWFDNHLACLECGSTVKAARRIAAATLVQWTAGGSIGEAAHYLGFNPGGDSTPPPRTLPDGSQPSNRTGSARHYGRSRYGLTRPAAWSTTSTGANCSGTGP